MKRSTFVMAALAAALTISSAGAGAGVAAAGATSTAVRTASATATATATPKPSENAKLNRVRTPKLRWFDCYGGFDCATVKVPLDYDQPAGATTTLAVLRLPATGRRIGTLFVNPGGPGGSATQFASAADFWLSPQVRERFDVVGVDPRGIGFSDNVACLSVRQQQSVVKNLQVGFPVGARQESAFASSMKRIARSCSQVPLATSMSTAQVARDMEMVRRGLGEGPLSYLGFSYGSQLGTTYANMFPNNFRSLVIDGTLSPRAWSGTSATQAQPLEFRLGSGRGAWKALDKILIECQKVGPQLCSFAQGGDTHARFTAMTTQLKRHPVTTVDPFTGEEVRIIYADVISVLLGALYSSDAPQFVSFLLTELESMLAGETPAGVEERSAQDRQFAKRLYADLSAPATVPRRGFPYDPSLDAFMSVTCSDSRETTRLADYPRYAKEYDARAPHFGRVWLWSTAGCAGDAFIGQDEDAYTGPYTSVTRKSVLIVGNYWDPATSYRGAVAARATLGRARLISSDSWGHTAYGVSACVTRNVDRYLLTGTSLFRDITCKAEAPMFRAQEEPPAEPAEGLSDVMTAAERPLRAVSGSATFPAPKVWR